MARFNVAVLDYSLIPNSSDTLVEDEALAGAGEIIRYQIKDESELPETFFSETDAVLIWHQVKLTAVSINKLKKCRIIASFGVGFDHIDIKTAGKKGIVVTNVPDYGTEEVADHSIAIALLLLRNIFPFIKQTKDGGWNWKIGDGKLRRLSELTFGIVGLGRIGTAVALRAKAFGFKIIFFDPYLSRGVEKSLGICRADKLDELLKISDLVSLHCPLTDETIEMIGKKEFALMKENAYLVNTARAGVVATDALKDAVRNKKIAGAGFDVAPNEPLTDAELIGMENILFTPHAAFYSVESFRECRRSSALCAGKYLLENIVINPVNEEYLVK